MKNTLCWRHFVVNFLFWEVSQDMMRWDLMISFSFHCDQNFPESALLERGIVIFVKLFKKLFESFKFSSFDPMPRHPAHFPSQGSLRRFKRFDRSFKAGPNFIPRMLIKCSSVSIIKPSPSMLCSRKFCGKMKKIFRLSKSGKNFK